MALDMRETMRSDDGVGHLGLELRIGINSGPVVAGVIGRKRFLYDLWGDAVNMASRMETSSTPGEIQVTRDTYECSGTISSWSRVARSPSRARAMSRRGIWLALGRRRPDAQADYPAIGRSAFGSVGVSGSAGPAPVRGAMRATSSIVNSPRWLRIQTRAPR
jgi:hypothetical protein